MKESSEWEKLDEDTIKKKMERLSNSIDNDKRFNEVIIINYLKDSNDIKWLNAIAEGSYYIELAFALPLMLGKVLSFLASLFSGQPGGLNEPEVKLAYNYFIEAYCLSNKFNCMINRTSLEMKRIVNEFNKLLNVFKNENDLFDNKWKETQQFMTIWTDDIFIPWYEKSF